MEHNNASNDTNEQQEDRLSQLPNDILLHILGNVNIREVARAKTLSKRWTSLPPPSYLSLDADYFLPEDDGSELTFDDLARANNAMLGAAKSFLSDGSQEAIRDLYLRFYLINNDPFTIGELLGNAMKTRQITRIDFTIQTEKLRFNCTQDEFADYGRRFKLFLDAFPHVFAGITSLKLTDIRLTETDITSILSICKKLGYLWLCQCGSEQRSLIHIDHKELSELVVESCSFERIHLRRCPKLAGLTFKRWDSLGDPLSFDYVPCLQRLNLTNFGVRQHKTLKLSELLVNSTVTTLFMNLKSGKAIFFLNTQEKIWIQPEGRRLLAPLLQKLQVLTIVDIPEKCDLTWLVFLLEAGPLLKKLNITVRDHTCEQTETADLSTTWKTIEWEPSNLKHKNCQSSALTAFKLMKNSQNLSS